MNVRNERMRRIVEALDAIGEAVVSMEPEFCRDSFDIPTSTRNATENMTIVINPVASDYFKS